MQTSTRLPRPEVGLDSYRSAKILIDRHGDQATAVAGRRAQELFDSGEEQGAAAWIDILYAIGEMQRGPSAEESRH